MNIKANLPQWLPRLVAERACALYAEAIAAGDEQKAALIMQITTDPRMQRVWRELKEKHHPRGAPAAACEHWYQYRFRDLEHGSVVVREGFAVRAEWLQEAGMRAVFDQTIRLGLICRGDPKELTTRDAFMAEAERLRHMAGSLDDREIPEALRVRTQKAFLNAAKESEDVARAVWDRYQKDKAAAVTSLVGGFLARMFEVSDRPCPHCGQKVDIRATTCWSCGRELEPILHGDTPHLYTTAARIASVVLDSPDTMSREKVREHYSGPWSNTWTRPRPDARKAEPPGCGKSAPAMAKIPHV
jgi:hypothetical protein